MAPIVLKVKCNCHGCMNKIRKNVEDIPGVESVSASDEPMLVEVEGRANTEELRARLKRKMRMNVSIVSNGGFDEGDAQQAPMPRSSPPPAACARTSPPDYSPPPPPTSSSSYYTPTSPHPPPPLPTSSSNDYPPSGYYSYYAPPPPPPGGYYPPLGTYYNYDYSRGGPYYVPNYAPTTFNDENPNACKH